MKRLILVLNYYLLFADRLAKAIRAVATLLGLGLVILVAVQVIGRYVFSGAPIWISELARYVAIIITLLLAGILIREDNHLKVELVYDRFSKINRHRVRTSILTIYSLFGLYIANLGLLYSINSGFRNAQTFNVPMYYFYFWFVIFGLLVTIYSVERIVILKFTDDLEDFNVSDSKKGLNTMGASDD